MYITLSYCTYGQARSSTYTYYCMVRIVLKYRRLIKTRPSRTACGRWRRSGDEDVQRSTPTTNRASGCYDGKQWWRRCTKCKSRGGVDESHEHESHHQPHEHEPTTPASTPTATTAANRDGWAAIVRPGQQWRQSHDHDHSTATAASATSKTTNDAAAATIRAAARR